MENLWVVTHAKYVGIVKERLPGIPEGHILAEAEARNTAAPCIAWACWKIKAEGEIHRVAVFKEKPNLETAREYVADGHYLWNLESAPLTAA